MKKGVVFTMSTLLISLFLVMLALSLNILNEKNENNISRIFPIEKAGFVADDIDFDINKIIGTEISAQRTISLTRIFISDVLPGDTNKLKLIDYEIFAESVYAGQQNAQIDLNTDNLTDGKTEIIFSNGLNYEYDYANDSNVDFFKQGASSGALTYDINIIVNDSSVEVLPWVWQDVTGDINVNINFVDENASNEVHHSGKLNSALANVYKWQYSSIPGDFFEIRIGNINGNGKSIRIAESFDDQNSQAEISARADFPASTGFKWHYNADFNYSQGDVSLNRKIMEKRA